MPLRKILVPVADPARPGPAADLSLALAQRAGAAVTLLHVADEGSVAGTGDATADDDGGGSGGRSHALPVESDTSAEAVRQLLAEHAERMSGSGTPVGVMVTGGDAAERIPEVVHAAGFDLVVMEALRRSRLARVLFGSTADEVKRGTDVPVVMLQPDGESPETASLPPDALIVPLDREPDSEHVIPLAQELAALLGVRIEFVHAVPDVIAVAHPAAPLAAVVPVGSEADLDEAASYLDRFVEGSKRLGVSAGATVRRGHAVHAVQAVAGDFRNALIVTDSSERSAIARLILGSVPEDLVSAVNNPVMIVPGQSNG